IESLASGEIFNSKTEIKGTPMTYEQIMRVMLLLFVDNSTLCKRTGSLIELNMANLSLGCNADATKLTSIDFKMREAETDVGYKISEKPTFLLNAAKFFGVDYNNTELSTTYSLGY
ncbi:MAG: hypothetical protein RR234_02570, partial [Christensenella sp.]